MTKDLTCVTAYFNPGNYRSHIDRYTRFAAHMQASGVRLVTVECVFPTQEFQVTKPNHPDHIQVYSRTPLWLKENLINLGWARCHTPYVMWSDMDLTFEHGWVNETIALLQHPDCQAAIPFSLLLLEGSDGHPKYQQYHTMANRATASHPKLPYTPPLIGECNGGAWAFQRDALRRIGGLFDQHILGDGDDVLAFSLQRRPDVAIRTGMHPHTSQAIQEWSQRVQGWKTGAVRSVARHQWHGAVIGRGYDDRWKILIEEQFDPAADLVRNEYGVWECTKASLNARITAYFHSRQEDAV